MNNLSAAIQRASERAQSNNKWSLLAPPDLPFFIKSVPVSSLSPLFPKNVLLRLVKLFSFPPTLLSLFTIIIQLFISSRGSFVAADGSDFYNGPYSPVLGGVGFLGNNIYGRAGRYFNFYEQRPPSPPPDGHNEMLAQSRSDRPSTHDDVVQIGNLFLNPNSNQKSPPDQNLHKRRSQIASAFGAENDSRLHMLPARTRITLPGRLRAIIPFRGGQPDNVLENAQQQQPDYAVTRRKRLFRQPSSMHASSPLTTKSTANPFIIGPLISNTVNADISTSNNKRNEANDFHSKQSINKSGGDCPTAYGNATCVFQRDCPLRRLIYSASPCMVHVHAAYDANALVELPGGVCCLEPADFAGINSGDNTSTAIALRNEVANSPYLISIPKPTRIRITPVPYQPTTPQTTTTAAPSTTPETTTELVTSTENSVFITHVDPLPSAPTTTALQVIVEPGKQTNDADHRPVIAAAGDNIANEHELSVQMPLSMSPHRKRILHPDGSPQSERDRKIEAAFLDINQCGRAPLELAKNHGRGARIIGGTNTHYGQWPYFALLLNYRRPRCGGALINNQYMVTAAHCVAGDVSNYDLTVNLGDYDLRTNSEYEAALGELPSETFNVRKVYRHPAFQRQTLRNDIALLRLDKKVKFKPHIQPVCLPQREYVSGYGNVLGLGKQNENDPNNRLPTRLKKVELPIINRDKCRRYFHRYDIDDMIMDMHICAGGVQDQDACQGDSGGPISVQTDQHSELIGLVSFGWGCGQPNVPGVYSNIFYFRDWIIDTVINNMD